MEILSLIVLRIKQEEGFTLNLKREGGGGEGGEEEEKLCRGKKKKKLVAIESERESTCRKLIKTVDISTVCQA